MIDINCIIQSDAETITNTRGFFRVVGIDGEDAYLMKLDIYPFKAPFKCSLTLLQNGLKNSQIFTIDNFITDLPLSRDQLSETALIRLDEGLRSLSLLIEDSNCVYDESQRGRIIKSAADIFDVNPRTIRRNYYNYLAGGQTDLALVTYHRKNKTVVQKIGTAKRGPKPKNISETSRIPLPAIREQIIKGAKKFYFSGKNTLTEAYVLTNDKYFSIGTRLKHSKDKGSIKVVEILVSASQRPTPRQFRYICEQLQLQLGKRPKLPRKMRQEEVVMERRGTVRDHVPGPGFRFEIDSTKIQIQLVSRYNRSRLIGNPTLYIIIDVWSGAIVGYVLSLEHASWSLAAQALLNCFQDKGTLFKRLKLPYTNDDWPCCHLPICLTGDRAELLSNNAAAEI